MSEWRFPVEAGQILAFARALGDDDPAYANPSAPSPPAPPTFAQAADHTLPDYDRRPHPGEPWFGSGREPIGSGRMPGAETGGQGLHAEQAFEYHRPMRAGEILEPSSRPGDTWVKQGRRGGRLTFRETITEFRDENGELVVTVRFVGVATEHQVGAADGAASE